MKKTHQKGRGRLLGKWICVLCLTGVLTVQSCVPAFAAEEELTDLSESDILASAKSADSKKTTSSTKSNDSKKTTSSTKSTNSTKTTSSTKSTDSIKTAKAAASRGEKLIGEAQKTAPETVSYKTAGAAKKAVKTGLVRIKNSYYYLQKGKYLKKKWKTVSGARFYFQKNGKAAVGNATISKKKYVFSREGVLQNGTKTRIVNVDGTDYLIDKNGQPVSGWNLYGKKLYYTRSTGKLKKNVTEDDVKLGKDGAAKSSTGTSLKITCINTLNKITKPGMSKKTKIRKIWNYVCGFRYAMKYPRNYSKESFRKLALNMLTTHSGNCYGYACAFAALCKQAGCSAKVVYGLCRGTRDHRADGMTRHSWTYIDGRYYDPEANAAGWHKGLYANRSVSYREKGRSDI